jgi:hypothetical protein
MAALSEPERRDFWEIYEDRYQVRSTVLQHERTFTKRPQPAEWEPLAPRVGVGADRLDSPV